MFEYRNSNSNSLRTTNSSCLDAIALYGYNSISCHLTRLFSSVGIRVYLILSNLNEKPDLRTTSIQLIENEKDLPYLSSVLINCQNDLNLIKIFVNSLPNDYKQRMAYVECSLILRENQLETFLNDIHFTYYLCMNVIEMDSSTMIQPHIHLISSGNQIVFQRLLIQTNIQAKLTFLNQTKTPYDAFFLCLLYRYSQAIHLAIYAEFMAICQAANPIYPGNLQFLFDWSYVKRPLMRQMILQSASSSFTFTTINDFQLILECLIEYFSKKTSSNENHLKSLTWKLHKFISNLNFEQKQKPFYQLFTLY